MKLIKTKQIYQNSTKTNILDLNNMTLRSYGHWLYGRIIGDTFIFNAYRYSNTTAKHQREALLLLESLGVNKIIKTYQPESLDDGIKTQYIIQAIGRLEEKLLTARSRRGIIETQLNELKNLLEVLKGLTV